MSDGQIDHIEKILVQRYWLFAGMIVSLLVCAFAIFTNANSITSIEKRISEQDAKLANNSAMVEAAIKQQIVYQQQVAQYWDYMSKKNPKVKVPRVQVRPPVASPVPSASPTETPEMSDNTGIDPLTDEDLTRNTPAKSGHSPKSSTRKYKPRPTATPNPWYKLFKTTR